MVELRLTDGTRLDLKGDEIIALTYAVNDIGSIETRQGVSSNEFELPITDFNLRALGYPTNFNVNQNVNPFTKIDAEIYEDELRIAKGYIQITNPSLSGNTIPVVFFGENAEWFNLIKGKSIRELDLSEFNHIFQPSTIKDSFTNTEGYKYSLIDRNGLNFLTGNKLSCQCFTISTFQQSIVEAIVLSAGFKLTGSLLLDPLYKKTVIPDTNDRFYSLDQGVDRNIVIGTVATTVSPSADTLINFQPNSTVSDESVNYDSGTYTADTFFFANIRASVDVENLGTTSTDVTFKIKVNGTEEASLTKTIAAGNNTLFQQNIGDVGINGRSYYFLESGDEVTVTISTTAEDIEIKPTSLTDFGGSLGTLLLGSFELSTNSVAVEGININLTATLPDIDQADFMREVVFDHNALVTVNLNTKEIRLDAKKYIYSDALDWSNLIDLSEDVEISYTDIIGNYSKINDVKRAETDGIFIKEYDSKNRVKYGDGQINIDNDFLENRSDLFESEFGATYTINSLDENQALPYIIGEEISDTIGIIEFQNSVIRIPLDSDIDDFLDVAPNTIWALVTDEQSASNFNTAYSVSSIGKTSTEYQILVNFDFGSSIITADEAVLRLIRRNEEATPRKLIDAGNYVIDENNDIYASYAITSTLLSPEDSVSILSMPYLYFWNPLIGKPTDENKISLSYGKINIPSLCSNLLDDYYTETIRTIRQGKILRASFRLNQVDIFNLDFRKLVYLNFFINGQTVQGYFIINKIEEYTGQEDSTVVELIKY